MRLNKELTESMRAKGYITTGEAARLVKRPISTIRQWCTTGKVAFVRNGDSYFVNLAGLLRRAGEQQEIPCN